MQPLGSSSPLQEKLINQRCCDQRAPSHAAKSTHARRTAARSKHQQHSSVELPLDNDSSETKFPQADRQAGAGRDCSAVPVKCVQARATGTRSRGTAVSRAEPSGALTKAAGLHGRIEASWADDHPPTSLPTLRRRRENRLGNISVGRVDGNGARLSSGSINASRRGELPHHGKVGDPAKRREGNARCQSSGQLGLGRPRYPPRLINSIIHRRLRLSTMCLASYL